MTVLFESIVQAHAAIRPQVPVSPLQLSGPLSSAFGCSVLLKNEHLQPTSSFKVRGATNKIRILGEAARRTGVTTASTGNHGQAVARAGALAGVPVTVYVAASAVRAKVDAFRALGAAYNRVEGRPLDGELEARSRA